MNLCHRFLIFYYHTLSFIVTDLKFVECGARAKLASALSDCIIDQQRVSEGQLTRDVNFAFQASYPGSLSLHDFFNFSDNNLSNTGLYC